MAKSSSSPKVKTFHLGELLGIETRITCPPDGLDNMYITWMFQRQMEMAANSSAQKLARPGLFEQHPWLKQIKNSGLLDKPATLTLEPFQRCGEFLQSLAVSSICFT